MDTTLNTKELTYYESSGIINGRNAGGNGHFVRSNEVCPKYSISSLTVYEAVVELLLQLRSTLRL
jgi:hypothetical protein